MGTAQIIQLFRAAAFDPEGVQILCSAYDLATGRLHDRRPAVVTQVAERIIALAEKGERDPKMLANAALTGLGFDRD